MQSNKYYLLWTVSFKITKFTHTGLDTLKIAVEKNLKSVSIPAVTGKILGYPIKESKLIGSIIKCYIDSNQNQIEGKTIIICINDDKTVCFL